MALLVLAACGSSGSSLFQDLDPGTDPVVSPTPPAEDAARPSEVTLGAYYYNWWNPAEWDKGVVGEPRIGRYRGDDPTVAGFHITDAAEAGIDVFAVNWFAGESDRALREGLLRAPNLDQIRFCIHYDMAIRFNVASLSFDLSKPIPRVAFISDMRYIAQSYMNHPQYYRINGRPVVIIYLSRIITGDLEGVLDLARSELSDLGVDVYFVGDEIEDGDRGIDANRMRLFDAITSYNLYNPFVVEAGFDTLPEWTQYARGVYDEWRAVAARTRVKGRGSLTVDFQPGVIPQYNDTPVRQGNLPITSSSTREFSDMLAMARATSGPGGVIWITSWNEWHEGTTIEPSTEGDGDVSAGQYAFGFLDAVTSAVP